MNNTKTHLKNIILLVFVLLLPLTAILPPTGMPRVEAVAETLSCYDPDIPGFACTGEDGGDLYYLDQNGITYIAGTNNDDPALSGVLFTPFGGSSEIGGLEYCSTKNSLCSESVVISDPCNPVIGYWENTNGAGGSLAGQDITIAYPEINQEAAALCEELGTVLAFDIQVILTLPEPVDFTYFFGDLYIEIRDTSGNVLVSAQGRSLGIAAGGTSAREDIFVADPVLVNDQTYQICFVGDDGGELCETVEKTEDIQQFTLNLSSLADAYTIGGSAAPVLEGRESTCHAGLFNVLFRFILCPLIDGLFWVINNFYTDLIIPLLVIDPLSDSGDPGSAEAALFEIWNNFRIIANVLFIIVLLLAIFGLSFSGFQLFSAYELRKIIPRLVLGVIGIQLSWYIVGFALDIFNVLGAGVRGLILSPVEGLNITTSLDFGGIWKELQLNLGLAGGIGAAYVALKGGVLMGIGMILTPIVLGLFLVILTLIARKAAVMILILTAPVAFVAWILPNTQGLFKQWWDIFWKLMFMYPLIIAFLASGELFSKVITGANTAADGSQESIFTSVLGLIALFAPYFLIPWTFQFAGSAVAQIAGGLSERSKTISNRIWGDYRDPNSRRSQRRDRIRENRRQTREKVAQWGTSDKAGRVKSALGKWGSKDGAGRTRSAIGRWGSQDKAGIVRRSVGRAAISSDRNLARDANTRRIEAQKRHAQAVQTGQIEGRMAYLGTHRVDTGNALSPEGQNASLKLQGQRSVADIEAVLEDVLGKSNSTAQTVEILERWLDGDHVKYGAGIADRNERLAILSRVAERKKDMFLDLGSSYRDFSEGGGYRMNVQNHAKAARFLGELNSRRGTYRGMGKFRESVWDGAGEVFDEVGAIHARAQAQVDPNNANDHWTNYLADENEKKLVRQAAMFQSSMNWQSARHAAPVASEAYSALNNRLDRTQEFRFLRNAVQSGHINIASGHTDDPLGRPTP